MNEQLKSRLLYFETDLDGVLNRLSGDEDLYEKCLVVFLGDTTLDQLREAIRAENWDDAFTAAHALKGMVGNLGFLPLYHMAAEFVVRLRTGKTHDLAPLLAAIEKASSELKETIRRNCIMED